MTAPKFLSAINNQKGFTLIEVLVASFILFLVISTMTMVYRGAMLSSFKAERTLKFVALVAPITENIRLEIKDSLSQTQLSGKGTMGEITYSWNAVTIQQAKAPLIFDAALDELSSGDKVYKLWAVTMELKLKTAVREYQFSEVTW
ncbi:PilW family protein [Thalassotalea agariperforans]